MKKFEVIYYNEELAIDKLKKLTLLSIDCYIYTAHSFNTKLEICDVYILVYYYRKKIRGV